VELQSQLQQLRNQGLGLATISYDPVATLAAFAKAHDITFPMLADVGSVTIKKFGLLNPAPEWALGPNKNDPEVQTEVRKYVSVVGVRDFMVGIAFPGTFILDRQGRVKQRFFEDFYIERNTVSSLLIKLGDKTGAAVAGMKVSTEHLDITTYPSSSAIAPGDRFALVVEVTPQAKIHVYAPGAKGYRVIALNMEPNPQIRALPVQYPSSENYFFKPLNERVPAFQKPFRLVEELILEGTPQAQQALSGKDSISIKGTLEYQACNDRECFNPMSVPLSWNLKLRPLVFQRPIQQQKQ
jgi:peroxiredoxin